MKLLYALLFSFCIWLVACNPDQPRTKRLDMTQFKFATPEELASGKVDFTPADMQLIQDMLAAASRVLDRQSTLEQEIPILGKEHYYVPKLSSEEIRSVGFDRGSLIRFPPENDWDKPAVFKGFIYGFTRDTTQSPWIKFSLDAQGPYEYTVNIPITRAFLDGLGLVLVKTTPNFKCDNFQGKCHAFVYKSRLYPKLGFIFSTDLDRSDLKSGLPTNFRSVEIQVLNPPTS